MRKAIGVALVLLCVACGSKKDGGSASGGSASGGSASGGSASSGSASSGSAGGGTNGSAGSGANGSAGSGSANGSAGSGAPVDAGAPTGDASSPAAGAVIPPMTAVPSFGCIAANPARHRLACVVGARGFNLGEPSNVTLVVSGTAPGPADPQVISLLETATETDRGEDALAADDTAEVAAALAGFAPLDRGPVLAATYVGGRLKPGAPLQVGGMKIKLATHKADEHGQAPAFRTVLTVERAGAPVEVVEDSDKTTASVEVRAFAQDAVVVVEQVYGVGDEGVSGEVGQAWRCDATACKAFD